VQVPVTQVLQTPARHLVFLPAHGLFGPLFLVAQSPLPSQMSLVTHLLGLVPFFGLVPQKNPGNLKAQVQGLQQALVVPSHCSVPSRTPLPQTKLPLPELGLRAAFWPLPLAAGVPATAVMKAWLTER